MPQGKGTYGSKVGRPPAKKKATPKAKPLAKRARAMPLNAKQAKAAIQTLRNDAGAKTYRKNKAKAKKK
jgi:hypothetical protein|tara:strand:- start:997 stop:1203 length:207 start_codon:yes stop_codon:yes gene_type:complete